MAAAIEQSHDEWGIIWPPSLAPFEFSLVSIEAEDGNEAIRAESQKAYDLIHASGFSALWDDRDERPGVKFKDADLIDLPFRIVIRAKTLKDGECEFKRRAEKAAVRWKLADIPAKLSDNPYLMAEDPDYSNRLKGLGADSLVRAMLDGDWDRLTPEERAQRDAIISSNEDSTTLSRKLIETCCPKRFFHLAQQNVEVGKGWGGLSECNCLFDRDTLLEDLASIRQKMRSNLVEFLFGAVGRPSDGPFVGAVGVDANENDVVHSFPPRDSRES